MRKLELQLQGVLACIKEALPAVSGLKIALGTYDDCDGVTLIGPVMAGKGNTRGSRVLRGNVAAKDVPTTGSNQDSPATRGTRGSRVLRGNVAAKDVPTTGSNQDSPATRGDDHEQARILDLNRIEEDDARGRSDCRENLNTENDDH
ncbi:hypothetical protein CVT25_000943, partial [Psilocybe cyanescens]